MKLKKSKDIIVDPKASRKVTTVECKDVDEVILKKEVHEELDLIRLQKSAISAHS